MENAGVFRQSEKPHRWNGASFMQRMHRSCLATQSLQIRQPPSPAFPGGGCPIVPHSNGVSIRVEIYDTVILPQNNKPRLVVFSVRVRRLDICVPFFYNTFNRC
jgi:hypothetical protein